MIDFIKKLVPVKLKYIYRNIYWGLVFLKLKFKHSKAIGVLRNKAKTNQKIKVAFFVLHKSVWKYEMLYNLMRVDKNYEPVIIICPYVVYGEENMLEEIESSYKLFSDKGYNVLRTFDKENNSWLNVKSEINPDIIFFTNPHNLTKPQYYIHEWEDKLTCYVPYAFMTPDTYQEQYNQSFHNKVWKAFYETPIHKSIAKEHAINKGTNVIVTGYPGCDEFLKNRESLSNVWKIKDSNIKKIIWAPHHLMKGGSMQSNFLEYHDIFFELAQKYINKIQIVFKPHPLIKSKLFTYPEWGESRTNEYYNKWNQLPNGQLIDGEYVDLFLTSDALIHDCGSFIAEYIYTNKPSLFMIRNEEVMQGWNEFGDLALDSLYKSTSKNDIFAFIEDVVLRGQDQMKEKREYLLNNILMPPNNKMASQNIFDYINKTIY